MIDQKMIERLKKKDEQAFEYVYHETKRGIYAIIFSILKNHPMTEDLMQDVYMKMMQSIDQYKKGSNFKNWLLTIAKNLAIDTYRREKKLTYVDQVDYDSTLSSQDPSPDQVAQFDMMINILTEDQRSVVILKIADDMKFKDIAKILEKPLGTVLWLYQEAMKTLRKYEG